MCCGLALAWSNFPTVRTSSNRRRTWQRAKWLQRRRAPSGPSGSRGTHRQRDHRLQRRSCCTVPSGVGRRLGSRDHGSALQAVHTALVVATSRRTLGSEGGSRLRAHRFAPPRYEARAFGSAPQDPRVWRMSNPRLTGFVTHRDHGPSGSAPSPARRPLGVGAAVEATSPRAPRRGIGSGLRVGAGVGTTSGTVVVARGFQPPGLYAAVFVSGLRAGRGERGNELAGSAGRGFAPDLRVEGEAEHSGNGPWGALWRGSALRVQAVSARTLRAGLSHDRGTEPLRVSRRNGFPWSSDLRSPSGPGLGRLARSRSSGPSGSHGPSGSAAAATRPGRGRGVHSGERTGDMRTAQSRPSGLHRTYRRVFGLDDAPRRTGLRVGAMGRSPRAAKRSSHVARHFGPSPLAARSLRAPRCGGTRDAVRGSPW